MREVLLTLPERRKLAQEIAETLSRAILAGQLKPSDRLVEADLAQQLGVSRAPVREAIGHLAQQGLVESTPHRGASVTSWRQEDIAEVYSLRSVMEGFAVQQAGPLLREADLRDLEEIVKRMGEYALKNDREGLQELDFTFHRFLTEKSGHKRLQAALGDIALQTRMFIAMTQVLYDDPMTIVGHHQAIVDALRRGDYQSAEQHARQHIIDDGEGLLQRLADGNSDAHSG